MQKITSASNEKIKRLVQLTSKSTLRKEEGVFIAEGTKLVSEVPSEWISELYISESCSKKMSNDFTSLTQKTPVIQVSDRAFEKISTMKTPQGMLAVVKSPEYSLDDIKRGNPVHNGASDHPFIVILEDIQDPGNVGTVFRTAEAAGVSGIVLSSKCADPLSPKVVRSTMGAIFRMPFIVSDDISEIVKDFEETGIICYAARLENGSPYYECDLKGNCAIIIGNEGNGLSESTNKTASHGIYIPMNGKTESLNAAVSASILMYEAGRQRGLI